MADTNFGTFTKDGQTRVASSQAAAVNYRFNGWTEEKPATPAAAKTLETDPGTSSKKS